MPFDPNFPLGSADPSQWWHTLDLLRNFVQSNTPANGASGHPVGPDGIDDWFVPGPAPSPPNHPDNGLVPSSVESDGFPDDWIYPDGRKASAVAGAPYPAPQVPSSQSAAATPANSGRPAPRPDPFAAYWAMIPASRLDPFAWAPPDFSSFNPFSSGNSAASDRTTPLPRSLGQFLYAASAPPDIASVPAGGLFGGIPRMLAERAKADDPWDSAATGILGGIPKMVAASNVEPRGLFGSLADIQSSTADAQANATSWPNARPFRSPAAVGYQAGIPLYAYFRNALLNRADPTGSDLDQQATHDTSDVAPDTGRENATANILLTGGEWEDKEHDKLDPAVFTGIADKSLTSSPKELPHLPPLFPVFPRPSPPPPTPPPLRISPPPPPLSAPGTLPRPSPGQAPADVVLPGRQYDINRTPEISQPDGTELERLLGRVGPGPYAPPNGGVPLASPHGRGTDAERVQNNANGAEFGCHTCGTKNFGTRSGNPILDHQPSQALNPPPGTPAQGFPHCAACSSQQGNLVMRILRMLEFR
jgi:hypothetical protein